MTAAELRRKRENGRFYTEGNPFVFAPFREWAEKANLQDKVVLEPFAGANNIVRALQQEGYGEKFVSYDIEPQDSEVESRDTFLEFPQGFEVCVTNPPWLAKNSAKRRGLAFPNTIHDDLYKYALEKCLAYCKYVAAIIPATYLQSELQTPTFLNRLASIVFLHDQRMFLDTENPVCLALFVPQSSGVEIYHHDDLIGDLENLKTLIPRPVRNLKLTFNHPEGELGFVAIDGTKEPSIRFCSASEIGDYPVGNTSRMITRIKADIPVGQDLIQELNERIKDFRKESNDVFLTPFKGLRKDGMYRRRMDYSLARHFINMYA